VQHHITRAGRRPLALMTPARTPRTALGILAMAVTLGACADEPTRPNAVGRPVDAQLETLGGAILTVTNTSGGTEPGSIRWAVAQSAKDDTIRFDPSLAGKTITLDSTLYITNARLTIEGPKDRGITLSGGGMVRVIQATPGSGGGLVLRNLGITGGWAPAGQRGAGILATDNLQLYHTTVWGNEAGSLPAIAAGNLHLTNSTVSSNVATNTAVPADMAAVGATIAMVITNTTIANNSHGGINPPTGIFTSFLYYLLLAKNGAGPNCANTAMVKFELASLSDDASCGSTNVTIADAKLETLRDNGGPTLTHAWDPTSAAHDVGIQCQRAMPVDQRYVPRDQRCDIGAYEYEPTTITLTTDASAPVDASNGWARVTGTVACSRPGQVDLQAELKQDQRVGRASVVIQAASTTSVECGPAVRPWSISLAPANGSFTNGNAALTAQTANTPRWVVPAAVSAPVKLYWARK
jgi:hypothetical protein